MAHEHLTDENLLKLVTLHEKEVEKIAKVVMFYDPFSALRLVNWLFPRAVKAWKEAKDSEAKLYADGKPLPEVEDMNLFAHAERLIEALKDIEVNPNHEFTLVGLRAYDVSFLSKDGGHFYMYYMLVARDEDEATERVRAWPAQYPQTGWGEPIIREDKLVSWTLLVSLAASGEIEQIRTGEA